MRDEADRGDVCDAYVQLLAESMEGDVTRERVRDAWIIKIEVGETEGRTRARA